MASPSYAQIANGSPLASPGYDSNPPFSPYSQTTLFGESIGTPHLKATDSSSPSLRPISIISHATPAKGLAYRQRSVFHEY